MFILALVVSLIAISLIIGLKFMNTKTAIFCMLFVMLCSTVSICFISPKMHKQFLIGVVEYLIKINDDGSMSTTKQTTQTVLQKQNRSDK